MAESPGRLTEPPACKCHGEPQRWQTDRRVSSGGYWRCVVNQRAAHHRYNTSEKGRARAHARRQRRLAAGECVACSQPSLSVRYCWGCLSKKEETRV